MKKILAVLLVVSMLIPVAAINSFAASDAYKATWTLKTSVYNAGASESADKTNFTKGGSTVYNSASTSNVNVKPGQVVWVTVHLKTGSSYYAGEMENVVFYSNNIFTSSKSSNFVWNTKGKYTSICEKQANVFSKMSSSYKSKHYPDSWSTSKKNSTEFYYFTMYPNGAKTVANVDEDLVSFPIYVKSNAAVGSKGEIYICQDDLCTESNTGGFFYLNYYPNGDLSKSPVEYSKNVTHNTSKAKITYTVVSGGSNPSTPSTPSTPSNPSTPSTPADPSTGGTFDISAIFTAIVNFFKMIINFFSSIISLFTK